MRATLVRNINDGLLYVIKGKQACLADIRQGNVLKIPIADGITVLDSDCEFDPIYLDRTQDGTLTFLLKLKPAKVKGPFGQEGGDGSGGGGGSGKGVKVQDDGTQVGGIMKTLNFIGDLVTVTDAGGNKADITIVIPSMTTAQRIALTPTTALIVEDTDLDMYFKWSTVTQSWNPF